MLIINVLGAFTKPFNISYYYVNVFFLFITWVVVVVGCVVFGVVFDFQSFKSSGGIIVFLKGSLIHSSAFCNSSR